MTKHQTEIRMQTEILINPCIIKSITSLSLLGRGGFLQVPHFQRVIFRRGDQNRLNGVKRKPADRVEVVSESELRVPRLTQGVFIISDLRKAGNIHKYSTAPLKLIPAVSYLFMDLLFIQAICVLTKK